jgi:hypothetical protein
MKLIARLNFGTLLLLALMSGSLLGAPLPRSVSTSRQFIVFGADVPLRGAVADLAERTKANLLAVLQKRDDWKTPIVIHLQFPQANVPETPLAELHFSQTGAGLKLQLDLVIGADVNAPSIQRELLRALLLELIYRNHPDVASGTFYAQAPDWLLEGILGKGSSAEKETLMDSIASSADPDKVMPLPDFLRQNPEQLDSPARLLYRAHATALLQLLLNEPSGPSRLAAYIDHLSQTSNDPLADLTSRFPSLALATDDVAIWKSVIARSSSAYRVLTFTETNRRLDELLRAPIAGSTGGAKAVGLENFLKTKVTAVQATSLRHLSQDLLLLSTLAHPVMRPVVVEYQQIALRLASGKRTAVERRLARLKSTQKDIVARMNEIDDYMNWFEATQAKTSSGAFTDYLKAAGQADAPEKRRRDALSVYLDAVEAQFQN